MNENKQKVNNKTPPKFNNTQHFVEEFLNNSPRAPYTISLKHFYFLDCNEKRVKKPDVELLKFYDLQEDKRNISPAHMQVFLRDKIDEKKEEIRDDVRLKCLTHVFDNDAELKKLSCIVYKDNSPSFSTQEEIESHRMIFIITMKYWYQTILQKMAGRTFVWPIIPVFWSKRHGSGKSSLMLKIVEPFDPFVMDADLEKISNTDVNYKMFSEYFIITCEEMAGAAKSKIESIKKIVTARDVFARIFHSQDQIGEFNSATPITTSNVPVANVLNDPTDNRRFADIHVPDELTQEEIDTIDPVAIVQNETIWDAQKIQEMRALYEAYVKPMQQDSKKIDFVPEFIEACGARVNPDPSQNAFFPASEIYGNFVRYWSYQGYTKSPKRKQDVIAELCLHLKTKSRRTKTCWMGIDLDFSDYNPDCADSMRSYVNSQKAQKKLHVI